MIPAQKSQAFRLSIETGKGVEVRPALHGRDLTGVERHGAEQILGLPRGAGSLPHAQQAVAPKVELQVREAARAGSGQGSRAVRGEAVEPLVGVVGEDDEPLLRDESPATVLVHAAAHRQRRRPYLFDRTAVTSAEKRDPAPLRGRLSVQVNPPRRHTFRPSAR